ncbi:MAG: protoporphyrinogen oxidase HemJ [Pseudomonadales bacterium]|nr:protoporphyrinogen oxidase HemJ [Pseudomonadales bacterium]
MLWLKAFHIISIITWFAGIFYLPRLFVYHATATDRISQDRFVIMEDKLYRIIMTPSALVALACGAVLVSADPKGYFASNWFLLKLGLVALVLAYHIYCKTLMRQFSQREAIKSHKFYRVYNEFPVLILISIILLVELQPF